MISRTRTHRRVERIRKEGLATGGSRRSAGLRSTESAKPPGLQDHYRVPPGDKRKDIQKQKSLNSGTYVDAWLRQTYQPSTKNLKRKRSGDLEEDSSPAPLTKRNLRIVENMGRKSAGGKSTDSGWKTNEGPKSTRTPSQVQSSSKATVSTTDSQFARIANRNGILPPHSSTDPTNLDALREKLNRQRATASPTETQYKKFRRKVGAVQNELHLKEELHKVLFKDYADEDADEDENEHYTSVPNQALTAFPKNVGFNNGLSAPQPDMIEGLHMNDFLPFPVDEILGGAAVLTNNENPITLPHIAGELKAPGKDMKRAAIQAAYDGAAMVYGRAKANDYLGTPDPHGQAYVTTFTTDGSSISTYAHHASSSKGKFQYHQVALTQSSLVTDYQSFKTGRRQLRNLQDHARELSYALRDRLVASHSAVDSEGLVDEEQELHSNQSPRLSADQAPGDPTVQIIPLYSNEPGAVYENSDDALENESYQFVEIAEAGSDRDPHIQPPLAQNATYVTPTFTEPARRSSGRHSEPHQTHSKRRSRKGH